VLGAIFSPTHGGVFTVAMVYGIGVTSSNSKAPDRTTDPHRLSGNQPLENFCLGQNQTTKAQSFMRVRNQ